MCTDKTTNVVSMQENPMLVPKDESTDCDDKNVTAVTANQGLEGLEC